MSAKSMRTLRCASKTAVAELFELQPLEIRQLLSSVTVDSSHVLQVVSNSGNDTIFINGRTDGNVSVVINGVTTVKTPGGGSGQFTKIHIDCQGGNDSAQISNNITAYTSSTIEGKDGNDTLTCGRGLDPSLGGTGDDEMDGG